jgi:hypothetical protein
MAPFLIPVAASVAGAAITGMMNKGGKMAKMPTVAAPPTGDQDKTPGQISNPALANAASQNTLSNSNTTSGKLLGG